MLRLQRGFSLAEGLTVIAIAGFAMLISIPQTLSFLSGYKLKTATQQVATALQFTRAKAVSQNFPCTFTKITSASSNQFQIAGGEVDGGDGLHPWEDRNGNGVTDSVSFIPQELPRGIKIIDTVTSVFPLPVTGNPDFSAATVTFSALGVPLLTSSAAAIYLENGSRERTAVTVDLSGRVQSWKQSDSSWVAM